MATGKNLLRRALPAFLLSWYHFVWAVLGAVLCGFPARRMTVIGVTGTDGKSTTVEMVTRILKEAGRKACSTSSVWLQIGDTREKNALKMGMPGRMFLQRFLRQALREGCTHTVIEVSSEGILQHRHRFLNFHTAVITNLSPEHIERHGSFENYRKSKQKLFLVAKNTHVVNGDDENAEYFLRLPANRTYVYGLQKVPNLPEITAYLTAIDIQEHRSGTSFQVRGTQFNLQLIGGFNAYNALAAICVGLTHGISLETCKEALEKMPRMPGRTEPVITKPFLAMIDYAVTPKALENLYRGIRRLFEPNEIILTNEDPYDEDPETIIKNIAEGAHHPVQKTIDRREAIRAALSMAEEGDAVVVSGKGSEDVIAVAGGKKIPWDERKVVEEEFAKLSGGKGKATR